MEQEELEQNSSEEPSFFQKTWWMLIGGIFIGLLSAGVILLICRPPQGAAIILRPAPTTVPIAVHITGAVAEPGVYNLPVNSRVEDVIKKAGGTTANADINAVNMAAILEDGMQVNIPLKINAIVVYSDRSIPGYEVEEEETEENGEKQTSTSTVSYPININTATQAELETLPGIGPVTAQKIIEYRQENAFQIIEDIQKVSGIGPATFEKLKDFITVGN
ncbi:MAG: hypothetical protein DRI56_09210 [Chloroflexota bacterium]|nr:MAG: hypothetical protein DRI56_09210 [Chloroflexota bacterium]